MSIASEITRLQNAKADIKTAIEAKGVTVPSSAKLDDYDTYVSQISGGGGTNYLEQYVNKTLTGAISSTQLGVIAGEESAKTWNMSYFLEGNTGITSLDLSDSTFTSIQGSEFCTWCTGLTSLTLPTTCTKIQGINFCYNTGFTSFTIPSHINTLAGGCLCCCANLTTFTIPSTVTSISSSTAGLCSGMSGRNPSLTHGLQRLIYQASVNNMPSYVARFSPNLSYVDLSSNVTQIGGYSFDLYSATSAGASTELVVVIRNTNAMVTLQSSTSSNSAPFRYRTNVKVYVPSALKSSYEADSNWTASGVITFYNLENSQYE